MAKLLVAVLDAKAGFEHLLAAHQVTFVASLNSAITLAKTNSYDAIICGIAFDDSRMFDLLQRILPQLKLRRVPFICCRIHESERIKSIFESLKRSCHLLGAEFIDFHTLKAEGREAEFAKIVEKLIAEYRQDKEVS